MRVRVLSSSHKARGDQSELLSRARVEVTAYARLDLSLGGGNVRNTHARYKACKHGYVVIVTFIHFRLMRQVISPFVELFSFYCI